MGTEMKVNSHGSKTKPTQTKLYISFFSPQMQFKLEISKDVHVFISILRQLGNHPTKAFKKKHIQGLHFKIWNKYI